LRIIRKTIDRFQLRAAGIIAVIATNLLDGCGRSEPPLVTATPIERLARAAPSSGRRLETRFSGDFRYAPLRPLPSSRPAEDEYDLEGVAGEILAESDRTRSADGLRAVGVARGLLGSFEESVRRLESASQLGPDDPGIWNDLAAARYAVAIDKDDPQRLPGALSAVDHALRLSPSASGARFNRALILTRLGIRNDAIEAWRSVLTTERDHGWAAEARAHLSTLLQAVVSPVEPALEHALQSADRGDPKPLRDLVTAYPQETRITAETKMLTSWAEAVDRRDFVSGERVLQRTRRIGDLLVTVNGDQLLSDIVRTISTASPSKRRRLAKAHIAYRDARVHYAKRHENSAEKIRSTAFLFACEDSPMEHVARYYSANAFLDSNRAESSRAMLDRVIGSVDANRYPSLAAGAEKELGLYYGFRGMWTRSLTHLERSRVRFATRREEVNAAFVEAVVGEAYDRIGDFGRGWRHRVASLDVLTRSAPSSRSLPVLIGAVHAEIMRGEYESALSLLQVTRRDADQVAVPDLTAETILREARVALIARGKQEAERALLAAKHVVESIQNQGTRERIEAEIAVVEAAIVRRSNPRRAVEIVTPAITFFRSHELGILLPAALLERGHAHLADGQRASARADFEEGLLWIEQQRANVAVPVRTTLFDTVPELTGELIDLLLASGDKTDRYAAYAVVERARARTLVEALGIAEAPGSATVGAIMSALPPNAVVVEFALLPDGVAAFCIGPKGLSVRRLDVKPAELRRGVAELRTLIEERKPLVEVQQVSAQLYAYLFLPMDPEIGAAEIVYLAPDRFLNATPFSALYDLRSRKYLVQKHRLILSPSGTFLRRRGRLKHEVQPALIIADPTSWDGGKRLDAARAAASEIAKLYGSPPPLVGRGATIERFIAAAPKAALIHYAGHARSDDTAGGFLPLAPSHDSDGRLDATAISRLPLQKTGLVILSACATIRGDVSHVEGMPSLSRAFLNAGAPAVIGMLWEIDDQMTARLLRPFHQRLHEGMLPSQALREAQIEMLTSPREELRHPASWAAAELLGVD
jgi:CHAT domain-containing protein